MVRTECWPDVPVEQRNDWRWQLKNLVRTAEAFAELSPYYFPLIDPDDSANPIRRMIVPSSLEQFDDGEIDPLGETTQRAAPGLIHRYPDRVLFLVMAFCSSYCRFCMRK